MKRAAKLYTALGRFYRKSSRGVLKFTSYGSLTPMHACMYDADCAPVSSFFLASKNYSVPLSL